MQSHVATPFLRFTAVAWAEKWGYALYVSLPGSSDASGCLGSHCSAVWFGKTFVQVLFVCLFCSVH